MDYDRTYALTEIARKLGKPRTTLNNWIELFREFLPTVGSGKSLRYREEAIEVFAVIAKMKDSGEPNEYIRDFLRGMVSEITVDLAEHASHERTPFVANLIEALMELKNQNDELKVELFDTRMESRELMEQVAALTEKVNELSGVAALTESNMRVRLNEMLEAQKTAAGANEDRINAVMESQKIIAAAAEDDRKREMAELKAQIMKLEEERERAITARDERVTKALRELSEGHKSIAAAFEEERKKSLFKRIFGGK